MCKKLSKSAADHHAHFYDVWLSVWGLLNYIATPKLASFTTQSAEADAMICVGHCSLGICASARHQLLGVKMLPG